MSQEIAVDLLGSEYQYAIIWGYALTNALHESSMVVFDGLKIHIDSKGK
jgi:hypothetical protein